MGSSRVTLATSACPVREILIAAPDVSPDLYRLHQQVWEHAQRAATPGVRPSFLFRAEQGVIRVRSGNFARGVERRFRPGVDALMEMAAVVQTADGREMPVAHADLPAWARDKVAASGFEVQEIEIQAYGPRSGLKTDCGTGRRHNIVLPVASLRLRLLITDPEKASCAWRDGIGRGKRFGLGMLVQ